MTIAFEELRPGIEEALKAADFRTTSYIGEALSPPCACVIPGTPYMAWVPPSREIPFGCIVARIDVLLVSHREAAKKSAALIEEQILKAVKALQEDYDIKTVSQPRVVTLSGAKFVAAVLTIEETVKEPD